MWSMGVLRMRVCWKESDVELLLVVLLRVVDEVVVLQEVLQDAVGVGVVLDMLVNEEDVVAMRGVVEEVRTAWSQALLEVDVEVHVEKGQVNEELVLALVDDELIDAGIVDAVLVLLLDALDEDVEIDELEVNEVHVDVVFARELLVTC